MIIHATCVALPVGERLLGVLIEGPSGAGKSDLALRLIDSCPEGRARLVADDRVALELHGEALIASAPEALAGRLEVRGVGVVAVEALASAPVRLVVTCVADEPIPRLPPRRRVTRGCADLPEIALAPFEASAPAKIRIALRAFENGLFREEVYGLDSRAPDTSGQAER